MRNFLSAYMAHKKITIPVTILVIGVIAGGIVFGVSATSSNKDNTTASSDIKVEKKAENKNTSKKSEDESDTKSDEKSDNKTTDEKSATASKNDNTTASSGKKPVSSSNSSDNSSNNSSGTSNPQKDIDDYIANNNANIEKNTPVQTCPTCGEKRKGHGAVFMDHDCPNTYDFYGNIVPKNSRYVEFVGGYGTKRYSDGTFEVTDEGRDAVRHSYEGEKYMYESRGEGDSPHISSLDAYVIFLSGV